MAAGDAAMTGTGQAGAREAKQQRRQAAREERLRERQQAEARRRRRERLIYAGVAAVAVAIIGVVGWSATRPKPGVQYADQGQVHIQRGQPHPPYNSNPPTSGWHYPDNPPPPGTYREEIPDELAVHALEHGCIWITYRDAKDTDLASRLEALAARFPASVLVSPRARDDRAIAVAAWRRLLTLDRYDEGPIVEFIQTFRNQGPERINCVGAMP